MKILILNGPNLNLTGERETELYGRLTFDDFLEILQNDYPVDELSYFQSNVEGEIITRLHEADREVDAIIINAGAYTHTSVAIGDAIKSISTPVVEVHMSNIYNRESFRHVSYIAPNCKGVIVGFGLVSYRLAIDYFLTFS